MRINREMQPALKKEREEREKDVKKTMKNIGK